MQGFAASFSGKTAAFYAIVPDSDGGMRLSIDLHKLEPTEPLDSLSPTPAASRLGPIRRYALLTAAVASFLAAVASAAQAGDASARRVIGFSPDGAYFAFEQYGTLDRTDSHSGWSEIAILDTRTDEPAAGAPIVVASDKKGDIPLNQARALAASQAAPLLVKYAIGARGQRIEHDGSSAPDTMIAANEIGRVETASERLLGTFQLEQILADSAKDCSASFDAARPGDKTGKALGFRLTLETPDGAPLKVLHEDKSVPEARNCPTSYSLSEVYEWRQKGKPTAIAVLVQRFSQGHDGRDRRFIAVTGQVADDSHSSAK
jgi:predicted secreted protein